MSMSASFLPQGCGNLTAAVRDFLRRAHPQKTARCAEAACALAGFTVPARTVERWLAGVSSPSAGHLVALIAAYGPNVLEILIAAKLPWLSAARAAQDDLDYARARAALDRRFRRRP